MVTETMIYVNGELYLHGDSDENVIYYVNGMEMKKDGRNKTSEQEVLSESE